MSLPRVDSGLDRVAGGDRGVLAGLRGRRLGLLAHPASVDRELRPARAILTQQGLDLRALFGPEHGLSGAAQDMIPVDSESAGEAAVAADLPVYSLYGDSEEDLVPKREQLAGLDAIVVDLQDVGSRYYTYVWTAVGTLRAAAAASIQTIVLDRPNPIGGALVEGGPQRPGYRSFVGLCDVAVRHAMTIGEICNMARQQDGLDPSTLEVVTMLGYERSMDFAQTGLPWVLPSPNMPTLDTARVYPGGCLLEGTNLSEGRGTTRPFEIWGAPFVDPHELCRRVGMPGVTLRPLHFEPTFHKYAKTRCGGVQVHVTDRSVLRPYELYLRLIAAVFAQARGEVAFRTEPYEFVRDRPAIDLLTGGPEFRELCEAADAPGSALEDLLQADRAAAERFATDRRAWLLY